MAFFRSFSFIFLSLYLLGNSNVSATVFTVENKCSYTVWPGTLASKGGTLGEGGFELGPGASRQLNPPAGWSGRVWARTGCSFDNTGAGRCTTGDCGALRCTGGGATPTSLAEFTLNGDGGKDFYDVSLVDGYNVGIGIRPTNGGSGDCKYAGCVADLNGACPSELQVTDSGSVVACKSACAAFNTDEYCCRGAHNTPQTCAPNKYSMVFKNACPSAYSYAYDDQTSTFTCTGSDYTITFCPKS